MMNSAVIELETLCARIHLVIPRSRPGLQNKNVINQTFSLTNQVVI